MIFRNLKYFIIQGFRGLVSNSLMTLASIGIVVASLVLLGFFVLFGMNLNTIGDQIKEQCEINVYVPNEMDRDSVRAIGSQLTALPYVKEALLYTKEERLLNYKEGVYHEQAEIIDTLEEDNPLRDAYILTLDDVTKATEVATAASQIEGVEEVVNRQDLIQKILSITNTVQHVSIWLMVILAAISVFIISNTIKLGMFSRRKEINIMKFVGATNWFIRWPFIIEGMLLGAVGAGIATVIVMLGYGSVLSTVQAFMGNLTLLSPGQVLNIIIIAFLVIGMGFGMLGSAMSIRKHLHV